MVGEMVKSTIDVAIDRHIPLSTDVSYRGEATGVLGGANC